MGGDRRDSTTWVVVELSRAGEQQAEDGTLASAYTEVEHVMDLNNFKISIKEYIYITRVR